MAKITVIVGCNSEYVDAVILPEGKRFSEMRRAYIDELNRRHAERIAERREWQHSDYINLVDFLLQNGCRKPTEDELEEQDYS